MKPKLIDSKKIFNIIKIQRNAKKNIIIKKRNCISNLFIFLFIIFIVLVVYFFINEKKPIQKIKNKNKNKNKIN